jgi:hypothetical protein
MTGASTVLDGLARLKRLDLSGNPNDPCLDTVPCQRGTCDRGICLCPPSFKGSACEEVTLLTLLI